MANTVLFIAPLPPPTTGQSLASAALLRHMRSTGNDVRVVNLRKQALESGTVSIRRLCEVSGIFARVLRERSFADFVYLSVAQSIAGNLKDLLILTCLLGRLDRTYIHLHGGAGMAQLLSSEHVILKSINALFLRRLGGVIVLGDRLARIYKNLIPSEKIHVVNNFAPNSAYISSAQLNAKWCRTSPLRLLFLSNLLPGKGHDELIAALRLLSREHQARVHVDFAGEFGSASQKSDFLKSIASLQNVKYHGFVDGEAKQRLLSQSHLFCLPTYYLYEGQPISILEAYAAGCAVLTTDHGGIYDVFTPNVNGVSVEKRSPQSVADAISFLMERPETMRRFSVRNARLARQRYRMATHLNKMHDVLCPIRSPL